MIIYLRKRYGCCERWGLYDRDGRLLAATGQYRRVNQLARELGARHVWHDH